MTEPAEQARHDIDLREQKRAIVPIADLIDQLERVTRGLNRATALIRQRDAQANVGPPTSDDSDRDGLPDPNHHNDAHSGSWRFIETTAPQPQLKDHT